MGKTKQLMRSALSIIMVFAMILGTVSLPLQAADVQDENTAYRSSSLEGMYRVCWPEESTYGVQRIAPANETASAGAGLWLWEHGDGKPYDAEMFSFEDSGDGTLYWYCKQSNKDLVVQANQSSVTLEEKKDGEANQKWTLEPVNGQEDQYYLKSGGNLYVSAASGAHTQVITSSTPTAWKLARVEASISLSLSASSARIGDSVTAAISGHDAEGNTMNPDGAVFTSSNQDVATVNGNVITAVGTGTATIQASLDGTNVTAELKVLAPAQEWGGVYRIDSALFEGFLLEPSADAVAVNVPLYLWNTALTTSRMWVFSEAGDGYVYWHPRNNLGLALQGAAAGEAPALQNFAADNESQKWKIVKDEESGNYRIQNKVSEKYIGTENNENYKIIKMSEADAASALWIMNELKASISLDLGRSFLKKGSSVEVAVTAKDAAGAAISPEVTLESSDPTVASVNGLTVTGLKAGAASITASAVIGGKTYTSNLVRITVTEEEPMFTGQEWYKDITTAEVNREPSHADFVPYQDAQTAVNSEKSALDNVGAEASNYYKLLSRKDWDFALVRNPSAAEEADANGYLAETLPEAEKEKFKKEYVPHSWQTYRNEDGTFKYFDEAIYTNSVYPWGSVAGNDINYDDPQAPLTYNPVGYYRTEFDTPEGWDGREVFISFQAVKSAYYLYINGEAVGYTEDSHSAHDFNITPYLKESGKNTLALKVYRWSDGSYLENQDYIQQSGILRDVYLYSKDDKAEIRDFFVQTSFKDRTDKNSDVTMNVDVDVRNLTNADITDGYTVDVKLLDETGKEVGKQTLSYDRLKALDGKSGDSNPDAQAADGQKKENLGDRKTAVIEVKNPKKWFPDTPNLYMVTIELKDSKGSVVEAAAEHVGFREIYKININDAGQESMQITGQKLMFRGVNRHDTSLENGNAVTDQEVIDDLKLMKQFNVNAVRTSHYPNGRLLYDLADELGIYIYAEANVESHYGAYGDHQVPIPGGDNRWVTPVVDRNMNMVELLKNHASIIGWSYGNEATYTRIDWNDDYCFWAAAMAVLHRDPSRLRMYERESDGYFHRYQKADGADPWALATRENNIVDVHSTQYPEAWAVENYAKNTDYKMPYFEQEYAHAMGQSFGSFNAFWDLNRKYDNVQGGFIWDWVDQALLTKREGQDAFWGYGGDWIDAGGNADAFCGNGLCYADRTPSAKAVQMRYDHQQVNFYLENKDAKVTDKTIKVKVKNELENTDLSAYNIKWSLKKDDASIKEGTLNLSTAAMKGSKFGEETVSIELPEVSAKAGSVYMLEFSVENKKKPDWDTSQVTYDNVIAHEQFDLTPAEGERTPLNYNTMDVFTKAEDGASAVTIEGTTAAGKVYSMEISKTTGILSNYTVDGKVVLEKGPVPSFWRAQNYNDTPVKYDSRLRNADDTMTLKENGVKVTKDENNKHIRVELDVQLAVDADQSLVYDIYGNGEIVVNSVFAPKSDFAPGNRSGNFALPKVGLRMTLAEGYENLEYFGRGPDDNYIDRKTATDIGVYQSTVTKQFDRKQLKPQENGNRTDVYWTSVTDADGNGIMVTADGRMETSALHVKAENINLSTWEYPYNDQRIRHSTEVPMDGQTYLCLDTMQRGVSNTGFFNHVPLEGFYPHTRPDADGNYPVYEKTFRISPITSKTNKMKASKLGFKAEAIEISPQEIELAETMETAEAEAAKADVYTKATLDTLKAALAAAEKVTEKEDASEQEVSEALAALKAAVKGLVTQKRQELLDANAALDAKLAEAEKLLAATGVYTEESLAALRSAYNAAKGVRNNEAIQKEENASAITDAIAPLQAAISKLQKKQRGTQPDPQVKIPAAGSTFTYKNAVYKVVKSAKTGGTVTFVKPLKKTNKRFTVPNTAKESKSGITFAVIKIEKNAFKGNKKLTQVTIGKNVTEIGANAFNGARKLKKITVKSTKLKKVGKNAFKGIHKKCRIKVPKKKIKAYKKIFRKKGQKSSVKIGK